MLPSSYISKVHGGHHFQTQLFSFSVKVWVKDRFSQPKPLDYTSVLTRRLGRFFSKRCILFRSIASSIS
jgi:hypothetical protein